MCVILRQARTPKATALARDRPRAPDHLVPLFQPSCRIVTRSYALCAASLTPALRASIAGVSRLQKVVENIEPTSWIETPAG